MLPPAVSRALAASLLSFLVASCEPIAFEGDAVAVFTLPRTGAEPFFDLPWPSDLRRDGGTIDVRAFPNPSGVPILRTYLERISTLEGYSVSAPGYVRFGTAIDPASLPASPGASLENDASVFLMNVDPGSPGVGARHPAVVHYYDGVSQFWPGHCAAVRPVFGAPLLSETTYAIVVTRGVQTVDGRPLERSDDFAAVADPSLPADDAQTAARAIYEPALQAIEDSGLPRDEVLSLAVFTTQDPTSELMAARDWLVEQPPPEPVFRSWRFDGEEDGYIVYEGEYVSRNFQAGDPPYQTMGGNITVDDTGTPVVHGTFNARAALTVPDIETPETGFPLVIYAHGTGGDYRTFLNGGTGPALAQLGFATMGVDQIHHGPRGFGVGPEGLVFNFTNPDAFRDNARQSALDVVEQVRFILAEGVPRDVATNVFFDPERVYFFGHSQGGLNGPLFLAIDDHAKGGVLSGAGGHLPIALVDKVEPVNIPLIVRTVLRIRESEAENEHMVYEHPVFGLLQTWADAADPTNYVAHLFHRPRPGFAPKHILQTEGITDAFTPPRSMEALALAARIPLLGEPLTQIEGVMTLGPEPGTRPARANVASGDATAGLLQFDGGHFVAFGDEAEPIIYDFFASLLDDELPTIR